MQRVGEEGVKEWRVLIDNTLYCAGSGETTVDWKDKDNEFLKNVLGGRNRAIDTIRIKWMTVKPSDTAVVCINMIEELVARGSTNEGLSSQKPLIKEQDATQIKELQMKYLRLLGENSQPASHLGN